MSKQGKNKNIVFDERTDDVINTISISVTFIFISTLLYFEYIKIGNEKISTIIQVIFIIFGFLMLSTGFDKKGKNENGIKGVDSFGIGISFLIVWYFFKNFEFILCALIALAILVIGVYGTVRGILEIIYSIVLNLKNKDSKNTKKFISDLLLFLTKTATFILTVLNIVKTIGTLFE